MSRCVTRCTVPLVVAVLGLLGFAVHAQPASAASARPHHLVVVVAVPDLQWSDVRQMPVLERLATSSSIGLLADKTDSAATGCIAGLVTIDSGSRSSGPPGQAANDCRAMPGLENLNAANDYAVDAHALGDALASGGVARFVDSVDAVTMLQGETAPRVFGAVTETGLADGVLGSAERAAGNHSLVLGLLAQQLIDVTNRQQARSYINGWIGSIVAALPANSLLLVVGSSDAANSSAELHVVIAHGPGFPAGTALTSASTGRSSYAELIDIAPTIAAAVGVRLPSAVVGSQITATSSRALSISQLIDANRHAVADIDAAVVIRTVAITLTALALICACIVLSASGTRPTLAAGGLLVARVAAPIAVLSWLAQLVPWWRAGSTWLTAGVVAVAVTYALVMTRLRRAGAPPWFELVAIPVVAVLTLAIDQLAGGRLQLSAPLGDDPLEAGRFTGVGNTDFAILASSALLLAVALVAARSRTAGWRRLVPAAVLLAFVVVIDGAPSLGDDLGGVLSLVPASLLCLALLAGVRIRLRQVIIVLIAGVAVAALAAGLDYSRPAVDQTHLGHFVGQLLHGGGGTTLRRKIVDDLKLQGELPLVLAVVAWLTRRRWLPRLTQLHPSMPGLGVAAISVAILGVLGSLLNDSGVTVAVFCIVAVLPSCLSVLLDPGLSQSPAGAIAEPATG